jgi:hypothetical protein
LLDPLDLLDLDVEVIFYDTTSLHFEIDDEDAGDQNGQVRMAARWQARRSIPPRASAATVRTDAVMRRRSWWGWPSPGTASRYGTGCFRAIRWM